MELECICVMVKGVLGCNHLALFLENEHSLQGCFDEHEMQPTNLLFLLLFGLLLAALLACQPLGNPVECLSDRNIWAERQ